MFSYIKQKINQTVTSNENENYKQANYYNYFRILEKKVNYNEDNYRRNICLVPNITSPITKENQFKLESFDITSEIVDTSVVSLWTQTYFNQSPTAIEGKYQLPLSPLSVVSKFAVEYKDKVLIGKIKEKSKAQDQYSDAIASGGQAFLGEKSDEGLFNFMIGNLPPNEKVTIKLTIVSEIGTHLSSLHYCLHRYMFPFGDYKFNYQLNCQLTTPIKSIELDHYKPTIQYLDSEHKKATIQFSTSNGIKKNIIAMIEPQSSEKPQSFIEFNQSDNSYALALNFYPVFDNINSIDINQKSEYIFVIDCSGSMSGSLIKKAKRALEICVRSLNENNKFNIYCFGSSFNKVFAESLLYDDYSLEKASSYIDGIDANLGGTELLPPIKDILKKEYDPEYPRQIFILTDGEVSNRDQLIDYVAKESNTTRMFTFGIGNGVDQELIIGLSKACKGYHEFIDDNSEMENKVMKLLEIANEPTLSNIKIDWNGLSVVQSPSTIRPVFNRERMMVYGLLNNENSSTIEQLLSSKQHTVKMIGDGPLGEKLKFEIDLDFKNSIDSKGLNQIHTLAAFKQIQDLEEEERKNSKDHKNKIVELGKKYGLVSKHTSVIVTVEGNGEVIEDSMKTVNILENQDENDNYFLHRTPSPRHARGGGFGRGGSLSLQKSSIHSPLSTSPVGNSRSLAFASPLRPGGAPPAYRSNGAPPQFPSTSSSFGAPPPPPPSSFGAPPPPPPTSISYSCSAPPPPPSNSLFQMQQPQPQQQQQQQFKTITPGSISPGFLLSNTADGLMGLLKLQKANGSFIKSSINPKTFNLNDWNTPSELLTTPESENIWVTILIITKISKDFASQKNQWDRAIQKSIKWVKSQLATLNLLDQFDKFDNLSKSLLK